MIRPINISLSPNLELDDVFLALKTLLTGFKPNAIAEVKLWFENYFGADYNIFTFNAGRSAQWAILKALGIGPSDEVLIQAFTCVAVPNSIIWFGATPVFVDIDEDSYNMNPQDLVEKITSRSKAVIIQHTFGSPADVSEIKKICDIHNLSLIEDCAHALGATYQGKKVGTLGDAAFFSFGRDKVVSSVFGGIAITKNAKMAQALKQIEKELPESMPSWVLQQLLHPALTPFIIYSYNLFCIGKVGLWLGQKFKLLSKALDNISPAKYDARLASLALNQLEKLDRFNQHRKKIANLYFELLKDTDIKLPKKDPGGIYLRFAIRTQGAQKIFSLAKNEGILLGDWYSSDVLNLPTYPLLSVSQAEQLVEKIKKWLKHCR